MNETISLDALDLVWGAEAISRALKISPSRAFHLLETGKLPAKKVGRQWVTSHAALRSFFADVLSSGHAVRSVRTTTPGTIIVAISDTRQRYSAWVEEWPDGWTAQEVSDTGSGGIIADKLATREDAIDAVLAFVERNGGSATISDARQA